MDAATAGTPVPSLPRLGQAAPAFQAETTHGTIRLEDFKGSWLVLFSHPADFTPSAPPSSWNSRRSPSRSASGTSN